MGLFDLFRLKPAIKNDRNRNSFGEDLSRLTKDGELPWGWHYANRDFTEKIKGECDYFSTRTYEARKEGVTAYQVALKDLLQYREDVRLLCASKGECFEKWASEFINIPKVWEAEKEELRRIEENKDGLIKQENAIKNLRKDLISIIKSEPGVFQSDLYKRFDPSLKGAASNELYQMETHGVIVREKSGRSYKLYMK